MNIPVSRYAAIGAAATLTVAATLGLFSAAADMAVQHDLANAVKRAQSRPIGVQAASSLWLRPR